MLIFNKQYRTEEKIIAELAKKIKNAEPFFMHIDGNAEVYELPGGMWISFDVVTYKLEVTIGGKRVIELDCKFDANDNMQQARNNWFSVLLNSYARKRLEKIEKARQKVAKMNNAKKSILAKKPKTVEQKILEQALQKIKEL